MAVNITGTKSYTDIDINFGAHPVTGDIIKKTGVNAIIQSIVDIVQLGHYEKPFHPEIGSGVRQYLFELADPITATQLAKEIKVAISNFEPRADVINVFAEATNAGNGYNIIIEFFVVGVADPISITVFLERIR